MSIRQRPLFTVLFGNLICTHMTVQYEKAGLSKSLDTVGHVHNNLLHICPSFQSLLSEFIVWPLAQDWFSSLVGESDLVPKSNCGGGWLDKVWLPTHTPEFQQPVSRQTPDLKILLQSVREEGSHPMDLCLLLRSLGWMPGVDSGWWLGVQLRLSAR